MYDLDGGNIWRRNVVCRAYEYCIVWCGIVDDNIG